MHREIQIKQFPIVTTHWWPKTRNERFVWENEQYLYCFLPLVHNHVQVIWVRTHIRCVRCVRALWQWVTYTRERSLPALAQTNAPFTRGVGVNATRWLWMEWPQALPNWIVGPSLHWRCLRQKLKTFQLFKRVFFHTSHTGCVRTQITWTWLCTRGKKQYKYCSFSHTNRSFRVLGHQCVVTMGNCLIWISLCMFFFPLIETVTYTCHYMTDRLERFDLKTSKLDLLKKKRHLHLGCPWGKLIDTKF